MVFARFSGRVFLVLLLVVLSFSGAQAQKYRTAAGFRYSPNGYGLTVQQKVWEKSTLEGLALADTREVSATVLLERHFPILGPSLNYYFGAGGHVGNNKDNGSFGGFDGIVGLEYKIAFTPLVISTDFKPSIEFNSADWARFPTGLSLRYILVKEKKRGFLEGILGGDDDKKKSKPKKEQNNGFLKGIFNQQ
ncbi:hypothetical protein [Hymenobacter sp. DG25B]|uniref:hypothetical protein n=1 Tax=Hymenobacter sp. DG25B TaxID=1385664 RepID=UPI0005C81FC7|nr:hypothetical protein [Hymenobacter sp. DG25B]